MQLYCPELDAKSGGLQTLTHQQVVAYLDQEGVRTTRFIQARVSGSPRLAFINQRTHFEASLRTQ